MKTLEQMSQEQNEALNQKYIEEAASRQLEILQGCRRGNNSYRFIEDNSPPAYEGVEGIIRGEIDDGDEDETDDGGEDYCADAPHLTPDLRKLASFILKEIKSGRAALPISANNPLKKRVYVLAENGILSVDFYISDRGIHCAYVRYGITNAIEPALKSIKKDEAKSLGLNLFVDMGSARISHGPNLFIAQNR